MDTALFLTLFLFAVQIAAGLAPMIWQRAEHAWIARSIFWVSGIIAVVCFITWAEPMSYVTPNYVIATGLVIAAMGFVWQQIKGPPTVADKPVVSSVAPISNVPEAEPTAVAKKIVTYSERDIRELLDGLADAHDLVEKKIFPATHRITEATANWHGRIPNQGIRGFATSLREMNAALSDEVWKPIDALLEKYSRLQQQLRVALALDHEAARGEISRALKSATDALEKLPENPSETTRDLVKPHFAEAYRQAEIVYNWITVARTRIATMAQNVRTKGITGFE